MRGATIKLVPPNLYGKINKMGTKFRPAALGLYSSTVIYVKILKS